MSDLLKTPDLGTLAIMTMPDRDGTWLCAETMTDTWPLARFESIEGVRRFIELFALARSVSHAQGQSGI